MWHGVEYTAASGGMEEAIKNYCKKETGEPLLFFLGKCTKISAGLLPQEITGIFSMKKDMTQISMSYLLLPVKDYCLLPLHLPVPSMTFLKIAWSSSTDLPFSLAMATWRRADS